ncbi:NAD(P)-dependent oxidoreductase [Acidimangrovimonas sediminis]|uniref:NAD(P)-dependent oxidoreductase n=1 Tax=Acidimangrovimonas sediminis TaxID=2056283 RepID=UPI000C8091CC|nr:NAD(P)-dependent oxidoreductase [Acidimangrovimonas sediminis]
MTERNAGTEQKAAVVGLGAMGLGMAISLVAAGFETWGFDLSEARRTMARENGVTPVADVAELLGKADFIVFSLPNAQAVESVIDSFGGALEGRGRLIVVDTSTSEPGVTRKLAARLAAMGHGFVDAPVSGGPAGAAKGALTMMLGGAPDDLDAAAPVIGALSAKAVRVGPSGAGNVAKLVNNMLCATFISATAEGLRLAEAAGVDAAAALEVLNGASGGSTVSQVHFPTWVMTEAYDSGFTMALMRKDVRLARQLADETGADLPLTAHAAEMWRDATLPDSDDFTRMGDFRKD